MVAAGAPDTDKGSGLAVVVAGLLVLAFALGISVAKWSTAADVTSVITAVGSVVGTLVGAFFGYDKGSQGRKEAQKDAADAHRANTALALHVPEPQRAAAMRVLGFQ